MPSRLKNMVLVASGSIVDWTSKGRRAGAKGCGESTEEPTRENMRTVINKLVRNKTGVTDELIDAN